MHKCHSFMIAEKYIENFSTRGFVEQDKNQQINAKDTLKVPAFEQFLSLKMIRTDHLQ